MVEDAPAGVEAATAAGMRVLVVPSLAKKDYPTPDPAAAAGTASCHVSSALRSARLPVNLIGSPINYANRLIGSPITSQSTARVNDSKLPNLSGAKLQ